MTLNNGGDIISLIDAAGVVRDRFEYGTSRREWRLRRGIGTGGSDVSVV